MSVAAFMWRRFCTAILTLWGTSLFVFLLFHVWAQDPTTILLGRHTTWQQVHELQRQLGLEGPWYQQYFHMVKSLVTGGWGRSWITQQEISGMFVQGACTSLTLSVPAFFLSTFLSLGVSLWVGMRPNSFWDRTLTLICVLLMSITSLSYVLLAQWLFAFKLDLFPISGYQEGFPYFLPYILLPALLWMVFSFGPDVRLFRALILQEAQQDYLRTAIAKGMPRWRVYRQHLLKNILIPLLAHTLMRLPFLALGTLLLESYFAIPGMGMMMIEAVHNHDYPFLQATTLIMAMAYIGISVLTDLLFCWVDPRVKLQ